MQEDESQTDFNETRAEIFEAISHPARIKILQALNEKPMGFAELGRAVGIEGGGHLGFHLRKLSSLVKMSPEGKYTLTGDGNEALWSVNALRKASSEAKSSQTSVRHRNWSKPILGTVLVAVIVLGGVSYFQQQQLSYQKEQVSGLSQQNSNLARQLNALSQQNANLSQQLNYLNCCQSFALVIVSDTYGNATKTFTFEVRNNQNFTLYAQLSASLWGQGSLYCSPPGEPGQAGSYISQVYTFPPKITTTTTLDLIYGNYVGFCGGNPVTSLQMSFFIPPSTAVSPTYSFDIVPGYNHP